MTKTATILDFQIVHLMMRKKNRSFVFFCHMSGTLLISRFILWNIEVGIIMYFWSDLMWDTILWMEVLASCWHVLERATQTMDTSNRFFNTRVWRTCVLVLCRDNDRMRLLLSLFPAVLFSQNTIDFSIASEMLSMTSVTVASSSFRADLLRDWICSEAVVPIRIQYRRQHSFLLILVSQEM